MRSAHEASRRSIRSRVRPDRLRRGGAGLSGELLEPRLPMSANAAAWRFVDPAPQPGNRFGDAIVTLPNGNVVVSAPYQDVDGVVDAGAVHLFDGRTATVIATLTGSSPGDRVGSGGVTLLRGGDYVVASPHWDLGSVEDAGAVTWRSGQTTPAPTREAVATSNSLHGSSPYDWVGISASTTFDPWYDVDGPIDEIPALHRQSFDAVTPLPDGRYVVSSPWWDGGKVRDAGAVTLVDGGDGSPAAGGNAGSPVTPDNSLHGTHDHDEVGSGFRDVGFNPPDLRRPEHPGVRFGVRGITVVADPSPGAAPRFSYLVASPSWNAMAGAVTRVDGTTGRVEANDGRSAVGVAVAPDNSLHGDGSLDLVGAGGITLLAVSGRPSGRVVVASPLVREGGGVAASVPGAVTWLDEQGRIHSADGSKRPGAAVTISNSLYGSSVKGIPTNSFLGSGGVVALADGDYAVVSPDWDQEGGFLGVDGFGAVTHASGLEGGRGPVDRSNSLVGTDPQDYVGSGGVIPLPDGGFFVSSPEWSAPPVVDETGAVLIPGAIDVGAVTRVFPDGFLLDNRGRRQRGGVINPGADRSAWNSLVGTTGGDSDPYDRGDALGSAGIVKVRLGGGDVYAVVSPEWNLPAGGGVVAAPRAGAVVLVDTAGRPVVVDRRDPRRLLRLERGSTVGPERCLHGDRPGDRVGSGGVVPLSKGNFVVVSPAWRTGFADGGDPGHGGRGDAGGEADTPHLLGAVTWGGRQPDGRYRGIGSGAGVPVSSSNSLVGGASLDAVGSGGVVALASGHYVVVSPEWDHGSTVDVGAVTWGSGTVGAVGTPLVGSGRTLRGHDSADRVGSGGVTALTDGAYVVASPEWSSPLLQGPSGEPLAANRAGAVTWIGAKGMTTAWSPAAHAVVTPANSLVGSAVDDRVGSGGVTPLARGNYLVRSPWWGSVTGAGHDLGAVTWIQGGRSRSAEVTGGNSAFGSVTRPGIQLDGQRFHVGLNEITPDGTVHNRVVFGSQLTGLVTPRLGAVGSPASLSLPQARPAVASPDGGALVGRPRRASDGSVPAVVARAAVVRWGDRRAGDVP